MLYLLAVVPMTVLAFGPFGGVCRRYDRGGHQLADCAQRYFLTGAVIGGSMMFLVVLGLHLGHRADHHCQFNNWWRSDCSHVGTSDLRSKWV